MVVVDAHCHAGKGDGLTGPWDTSAPLTAYLARARAAGIDRTLLMAAFTSDYRRANAEVARIVASDPDRYYGFAFVHPTTDRGRVGSMIAEAVRRWGFCGIKAHRHDGRMTREIAEVAAAWSLPVLYDIQGDVPAAELLAREFPEVNWIFPHLGTFAGDWRAHVLFMHVLAHYPNVFTDTSGVQRFDLLREAVERSGPHKVLFGSDGPWLHPGVELAKVLALGLDGEARRLVLGGNFLRLVGRVHAPDRAVHPVRRRDLPAPSDPWQPAPSPGGRT